MGLLSLPFDSIIEVPSNRILGRISAGIGVTEALTLEELGIMPSASSGELGVLWDETISDVALAINNDLPVWRDQSTIDNFVYSIGLSPTDDVIFASINGQKVNSLEKIYNIVNTADPLPDLSYKRITIDATASTGNFTCTLTPPPGSMEGRLIIKNHTTPRIITIAISAGNILWARGIPHAFESDPSGSVVHLYWAYDGTDIYLAVTEIFS